MDSTPRSKVVAGTFLDYCISKMGWKNLTKDVVMDIGCGKHLNLGKALLDRFPKAKSIVCIDRNPEIVVHARRDMGRTLQCNVADIEDRDSLEGFEGRMTKIISTYTFHHVMKKQEAFGNVHLLLRPGGEAGFLFYIRSGAREWLTEMLRNWKWKSIYKGDYIQDVLSQELTSEQYGTMMLKLGFIIIDSHEEVRMIPCISDETCKEAVCKLTQKFFDIPSELLDAYKEDAFQAFVKIHGRTKEGKPRFSATELLLLVKKTDTKLIQKLKMNRPTNSSYRKQSPRNRRVIVIPWAINQ